MFVDENNNAILQADNTPVIQTWLELERDALDIQEEGAARQVQIDKIEDIGPLSNLGIGQ
jgi:hypothetical protein